MAVYWPCPHLKIPSIKTKKNIKQKILNETKQENQFDNQKDNQQSVNFISIQPPEDNNDPIKTDKQIGLSVILEDCKNKPKKIIALDKKNITVIPIILSRFTTQISKTFFIDLTEIILELLKIENKVKLTKCILLLDTNVLFIKGLLEKSITYTTMSSFNSKTLTRNLRHCIIHIPFSCSTTVIYNGNNPLPLVPKMTTDFSYLNQIHNQESDLDLDNQPNSENYQISKISTEYFNVHPYCEIEKSKIVENNQIIERSPWNNTLPYTRIEEKIVIYLTMLLLQNQPVIIPPNYC